MTDLDTRLIPKVLAIVNRLGKSVTFETVSGGSYDPLTRVVTGGTMTPVVKKVTPPYEFKNYLIDGDNIRVGDLQIDLPASGLTFTPERGWIVVIDTVRYTVIKVSPVYTGEQIALYNLQLRS